MFEKSKKILLEPPLDEVIKFLEEHGIEFKKITEDVDRE